MDAFIKMKATSHHALAAKDDIFFKHQPLDLSKPTIRIVHLLPLPSPNGHIQCSISHATIGSTYTCLSYCWGDPNPSCLIEIDDKAFAIGHNLFDFLAAARRTAACDDSLATGPYWIDALCIDQSNVSERNHQVRQMGTIYAQAVQVHVWLGPALPDIAVSRSRKLRSSYERQDFLDTNSTDELLQHVSENVYWTRAWIVQELVLAQQVIICIGPLFLGLDDFDWRTRPKWESVPTIRINPFWRLNRIRCGRLFNDKLSIRKSLIRLIEYFHDKQCSDPRDRIFSLLSIVRGEGEDLEVDYGLSRAELAFEVLRKCERSLCLCTAILVAQTLQLDIDGLEPDLRLLPCLEFCIKDIPVSSDFSQGRQRGVWEECVRSGLDFGATCRCSALYPWRLNPYLTYLDNAESLHRRPTQMEDITFRPVEGLDDIYIVRISLSFLATIVQHPVELCPDVQYKSKSDRFPVGYPRICYATDPLQPPGATDSSSLFVRLQSQPSGPVEKQSPAEYERFSWKQYSASILDAVKALRSSPLISIGRKYLWRDDPISGRIRSALIDNKEWLEVLEFERRKNGRDMNGFRYGLY